MKYSQIKTMVCTLGISLVLWSVQRPAAAEDFPAAIQALLRDHIDLEKKSIGMVVGIVDAHGEKVISYGKADNGQSPVVGGDTVFEIGSITKTFTALLLQEMVDRGEVKLDDPVSNYLPASVRMPERNGKKITLLHLATHTSGLPDDPDNYAPQDWTNPYANYTPQKLYTFLSTYALTRDPGSQKEYSNLGMGLLGHVIALKAGVNYESLVVDRICGPLHLASTRITLPPELKIRCAVGHSWFGNAQADLVFGEVLMGNGALHSTANDLLKYVSANIDLTPLPITSAMQKTHAVKIGDMGLGWGVSGDWLSQNGTTLGSTSSVTFDTKQRRGVVILSNQAFHSEAQNLASILLKSQWQSDKRPKAVAMDDQTLDLYVGQYQLSSKAVAGICRDGHRLFVQVPGLPIQEILPESKTAFFLRVSALPITFEWDAKGKIKSMTGDLNGTEATFVRVSDLPTTLPPARRQPAVVKSNLERYDAFLGTYLLSSGQIITISHEDDHLLAVYKDWMGFRIYPESDNQLSCLYVPWIATLNRNDRGETIGLTIACSLFKDVFTGKAVKAGTKN